MQILQKMNGINWLHYQNVTILTLQWMATTYLFRFCWHPRKSSRSASERMEWLKKPLNDDYLRTFQCKLQGRRIQMKMWPKLTTCAVATGDAMVPVKWKHRLEFLPPPTRPQRRHRSYNQWQLNYWKATANLKKWMRTLRKKVVDRIKTTF